MMSEELDKDALEPKHRHQYDESAHSHWKSIMAAFQPLVSASIFQRREPTSWMRSPTVLGAQMTRDENHCPTSAETKAGRPCATKNIRKD
jgi:hypothetical protein